jgi:hypothetical protein
MISAAIAFRSKLSNPYGEWHGAQGSGTTSDNPFHGSARVHHGFCRVHSRYLGPKLKLSDPVFTMGSCFARELESALIGRGGNVVSADQSLLSGPEFADSSGKIRDGFFHRFSPRAMSHEFAAAFGDINGWTEESLIFERGAEYLDLNYWTIPGAVCTREATLQRRRVAQTLVRRANGAKLIALTLGLIEAWRHLPTGFDVNRIDPAVVARNKADFELDVLTDAEVDDALETIMATLKHHHETGDFQLVITVSPVPMQRTFTSQDILVANMASKARLRNAASRFVERHDNAYYFPSFEMVMLSNPADAWRPDQLHVARPMVRHIMEAFIDEFYEAARPLFDHDA